MGAGGVLCLKVRVFGEGWVVRNLGWRKHQRLLVFTHIQVDSMCDYDDDFVVEEERLG